MTCAGCLLPVLPLLSSAREALPFPPWLQTPEPCKRWNLYSPLYSGISGVIIIVSDNLLFCYLQWDLSRRLSNGSTSGVSDMSEESGLYPQVNHSQQSCQTYVISLMKAWGHCWHPVRVLKLSDGCNCYTPPKVTSQSPMRESRSAVAEEVVKFRSQK